MANQQKNKKTPPTQPNKPKALIWLVTLFICDISEKILQLPISGAMNITMFCTSDTVMHGAGSVTSW